MTRPVSDALKRVGPRAFERFLAALWERRGYRTTAVTRRGSGRDVLATIEHPYERRVRIRAADGGIDAAAVRAFAARRHAPDAADEFVLATPGAVTAEAEREAATARVKLLDGAALADLVEAERAGDLLREVTPPAEGDGSGAAATRAADARASRDRPGGETPTLEGVRTALETTYGLDDDAIRRIVAALRAIHVGRAAGRGTVPSRVAAERFGSALGVLEQCGLVVERRRGGTAGYRPTERGETVATAAIEERLAADRERLSDLVEAAGRELAGTFLAFGFGETDAGHLSTRAGEGLDLAASSPRRAGVWAPVVADYRQFRDGLAATGVAVALGEQVVLASSAADWLRERVAFGLAGALETHLAIRRYAAGDLDGAALRAWCTHASERDVAARVSALAERGLTTEYTATDPPFLVLDGEGLDRTLEGSIRDLLADPERA